MYKKSYTNYKAPKITRGKRVRFNWGFQDGAADYKNKRNRKWILSNHFDNVYAFGYHSGYTAANRGEDTETSDEAWSFALAYKDIIEDEAKKGYSE